MWNSICDQPEVENMMQQLTIQLKTVKGRRSYGYLPKKRSASGAARSLLKMKVSGSRINWNHSMILSAASGYCGI